LQLVIIDKLPFPPPGDPLVEARAQRLESQGRSAFNDYFVPEAAVALKQGAGRLIRRESDQGVLVVCDTRLASMGYGRRLLAALPPMRTLQSNEEFLEALDALGAAASAGSAQGA
jgi:ATP-dependent DNA helicase DinG